MADRYCRNCGRELRTEDQFCTGCGRPVHATAHVPTPEADVPVPPPAPSSQEAPVSPPQEQQQPSEPQAAPWGPVVGMLVVFLVLGFVVTMEGLLSITAIILFIGGVYYVTARKKGVTLRIAIFNWPLVILAGIVTFLYAL